MTQRDRQRSAFADLHGWAGVAHQALPADASFRRYYRLQRDGRSVLIMDAPPPLEDVRPFRRLAGHLYALGLSAPRVLAADETGGFLLLEDFGDATFTRLLASGHDEAALYRLAVDVLVHLHAEASAAAVACPAYDEAVLLGEAALLTDWYWPALRGTPCPRPLQASYLQAWRDAFARLPALPSTLVLRDYHVDNLMLLDGRTGVAACGLLDFQDALIGSPAYDLVSLLEDARRDVPEPLAAAMLDRYLAAFPHIDADALRAGCAVLGAQRHAKVAGIFVRLCVRDGKPVYLQHVPRVCALLRRALVHPALQPVRDWMDDHLPDLGATLTLPAQSDPARRQDDEPAGGEAGW